MANKSSDNYLNKIKENESILTNQEDKSHLNYHQIYHSNENHNQQEYRYDQVHQNITQIFNEANRRNVPIFGFNADYSSEQNLSPHDEINLYESPEQILTNIAEIRSQMEQNPLPDLSQLLPKQQDWVQQSLDTNNLLGGFIGSESATSFYTDTQVMLPNQEDRIDKSFLQDNDFQHDLKQAIQENERNIQESSEIAKKVYKDIKDLHRYMLDKKRERVELQKKFYELSGINVQMIPIKSGKQNREVDDLYIKIGDEQQFGDKSKEGIYIIRNDSRTVIYLPPLNKIRESRWKKQVQDLTGLEKHVIERIVNYGEVPSNKEWSVKITKK